MILEPAPSGLALYLQPSRDSKERERNRLPDDTPQRPGNRLDDSVVHIVARPGAVLAFLIGCTDLLSKEDAEYRSFYPSRSRKEVDALCFAARLAEDWSSARPWTSGYREKHNGCHTRETSSRHIRRRLNANEYRCACGMCATALLTTTRKQCHCS